VTGQEREDLGLAISILRDWRNDDREWKKQISDAVTDAVRRIGLIEDRFQDIDTIAKAEASRKESKRRRDERLGWVVGAGMTLLTGFAYIYFNFIR